MPSPLAIDYVASRSKPTPGTPRSTTRAATFAATLAFVLTMAFASPPVLADTLVRVDTDAGSFVLELFEESAPGTVANFLSYVDGLAYENTLVHRSVANFVIQGGGYVFNPENGGFDSIPRGAPIANEYDRSNVRGTIAMAKMAGDPNSATSEWFISVADNSANLNNQNGGFTVFGEVIGEGMAVVDGINSLRTIGVNGTSFSEIPYLTLTGTTTSDADWVQVSMRSLRTSSKFLGGKLAVALDAGELGRAVLDFAITANSPATVITLIANSVLLIDTTVDKMASFDSATGVLLIPELEIDGEVLYRNLRFSLTDPSTYSFTLQSFD